MFRLCLLLLMTSSSLFCDFRHELSNIQAEMQMLVQKIQNQEDIIEALKRDLENSKKKSLDPKIASQDTSIKGFASDIKELKNAINQTALDSDARIKQLEKTLKAQSETIEHLRSALGNLVEGIKGNDASEKYTVYEVKAGDSLGVIAKKSKATVKQLKELNQLKNEIIFKGQKLKIPDESGK